MPLRRHRFVKALGVRGYMLTVQFPQASPAVSLMPAGSAVTSAELWMLSLTLPDLYTFWPVLLEERNKNIQAFWRDFLFSSPFFKITTFICFCASEGVSEDIASSL